MLFANSGTALDNRPAWMERCKLFWVKKVLLVQNNLLKLTKWIIYQNAASDVKKILIFRTGSLGDNICAAPSIAAIRNNYPGANITLLAHAGTSSHISVENILDPALYNEIIDYMGLGKRALFSVLKKRKFDLVVQLPQREALFKHLLRDTIFFGLIAKKGWGWKVSSVRYFKKTQEKYLHFLNETDNLLEIVKENGLTVARDYSFPLKLTIKNEEFVNNLFQEKNLYEKKIIAIVVGAMRPLNRWPIAYFKEVIEAFVGSYAIILIGGKGDNELVAGLEHIPGVVNFCGMFTPMQSAAAIKKCLLTLSNDTGPMHLSYAVGTPVIGLFSSRDFAGKWYPPDDGYNKAFRTENVHCSICFKDTCADTICILAIKPKQVIAAIKELLSKLPSNKTKLKAHDT